MFQAEHTLHKTWQSWKALGSVRRYDSFALFGINLCPRFLASVFHQMKKRNDFARGSVIFGCVHYLGMFGLRNHYWLVVSTRLKNISQWEGLSHILCKKTCSKPPNRFKIGTTLIYPCTWWSLEAGTNGCLWTNTNQPRILLPCHSCWLFSKSETWYMCPFFAVLP